jgi:fumarate hydratase, class II
MSETTRIETDSLGAIEVPANRLWGAQTERSRRNFQIGTERIPELLVRALGLQKLAAVRANQRLGLVDARLAVAIARPRKSRAANCPTIFLYSSGRRAPAPKPT